MIDLHIHSTASDGSFSPSEILNLCLDAGIKAIALTDHDSIDGVKEVMKIGVPWPLEFITGVEISCEPLSNFPDNSSFHILGYGFDLGNKEMNSILEKLQIARSDRNPLIIQKLNDLGFDISLEEIEEISGDAQIGRPHIAQSMIERNFVASFDEAFDKYLNKGKKAYVDKYKVTCKEAIEAIHNAGGISVLAHPGLIKDSKNYSIEKLIKDLKKFGLGGIEAYYTSHTHEQTTNFITLAEEQGLIITGGSDFHGSLNQGVNIGTGRGELVVFDEIYTNLINTIETLHSKDHSLESLEKNINYKFTNQSLLVNALQHRSYVNESNDDKLTDNERLEFLGDAVIELCISQLLMEHAPDKNEGYLSKLRSNLVSEPALAGMARKIQLGKFILLGKGERLSNGREKDSILSDTFEAVIAAIYLDSNFDTTYSLINQLFSDQIKIIIEKAAEIDHKSKLQELVQKTEDTAPVYEVINETGPDHDKTFEVVIDTLSITATGTGKTIKAAEQNAAANALKQIQENN
ncbi:MAG: ribonuclease III [Desulfobacteraceae bacterium]|nr:ribonuclease III [Desulfobacteraceae bacterium]